MKSAEQRARIIWRSLPTTAQLAIRYDGCGEERWINNTAATFEEHAKDQRHLCAGAVACLGLDPDGPEEAFATQEDAHTAVMNAPAPGEDSDAP